MDNILEKIVVEKKRSLMYGVQYTIQEILAIIASASNRLNPWNQLINQQVGPVIIAEIKRASPSRGDIIDHHAVLSLLDEYQRGGASAISVVTEERYFKGSSHLLQQVISHTNLPVLRKDFIIEETQIYESAQLGVNALLLIARIISLSRLRKFIFLCELLGIVPLVEVHDRRDLEQAIAADAWYIGINNRNLSTLEISLNTTEHLLPHIPSKVTVVCESGIGSHMDIERFMNLGIKHFLIGEYFLFHPNPIRAIQDLKGVEKIAIG